MNRPIEIRKIPSIGLLVRWSDGRTDQIPASVLRHNCPCAECRQLRGDDCHEKPLTSRPSALRVLKASRDESLDLKEIWGVGNYALGIAWGDGHRTGIYSYVLLAELGRSTQPSPTSEPSENMAGS